MNALIHFLFVCLLFFQAKSEVRYILRPVFVNLESPSFVLRYQYEVTNPQNPTLIFLQGGPGAPILFQSTSFLPSQFNILLVDPRGTGQSPLTINDPYSLSSFQIASDLAAIIKEENISNYFIWGTSYGTVISTILSSSIFLKEFNIPSPQALILEATVGRSFIYDTQSQIHENTIGLQNVAALIENDLSSPIKEKLSKLFYSLSVTPQELDHFLVTIFNTGKHNGIKKLQSFLVTPIDQLTKEIKSKYERSNQFFMTPIGRNLKTQLQYIACTELIKLETFDNSQFEFLFLQRKILNDSLLNECYLSPQKNNFFDSSLYQIDKKIPIFYFISLDDPKTPLFQTDYHFTNQLDKNSLNRVFILNKGGHAPLQNPDVDSCRNTFFSSLFVNNPNLASQRALSCFTHMGFLHSNSKP